MPTIKKNNQYFLDESVINLYLDPNVSPFCYKTLSVFTKIDNCHKTKKNLLVLGFAGL